MEKRLKLKDGLHRVTGIEIPGAVPKRRVKLGYRVAHQRLLPERKAGGAKDNNYL